MWNRVRRIPFTNIIPKAQQDTGLPAKFATPEVRTAILAWAVEGYRSWRANGLGTCDAVERSNEEYRAEMDQVAPFFDEYLVFETSATMTAEAIGVAYDTYCRENAIRSPLNRVALAKRLALRGARSVKTGGRRIWHSVRRAS
jgi:phage/plasmid-associated DNA primase